MAYDPNLTASTISLLVTQAPIQPIEAPIIEEAQYRFRACIDDISISNYRTISLRSAESIITVKVSIPNFRYRNIFLIFFKKMLMSKFFIDENQHQFFKLYLAVFGENKSKWRELVGSTRIINWKYWAEQFPDPDLIRLVIKRNEFLI